MHSPKLAVTFSVAAFLGICAVPVAAAVSAGPAAAHAAARAATEENCKTGTFQITGRPDSAVGGGTWAMDTFKRSVQVCRVADDAVAAKTVEVKSWHYLIKGKDVGSFTTQGAKSPMGKDVDEEKFADRTGEMLGEWSLKFEAPADWLGWLGGADPNRSDLSTSEWIKSLWKDGFKPGHFTDWKWKYTLCKDWWINASLKHGGNKGDIDDKSWCPKPSPTPTVTASASPSPTPTATASSTSSPAVTTPAPPPGSAGGLPVTGPGF